MGGLIEGVTRLGEVAVFDKVHLIVFVPFFFCYSVPPGVAGNRGSDTVKFYFGESPGVCPLSSVVCGLRSYPLAASFFSFVSPSRFLFFSVCMLSMLPTSSRPFAFLPFPALYRLLYRTNRPPLSLSTHPWDIGNRESQTENRKSETKNRCMAESEIGNRKSETANRKSGIGV